jgi:hypothetical protein
MINLALLIALISVVAAFFIYRRETPGIQFAYGSTFEPLGGWLILPLIGLFITPIYLIINLIDAKYFDISIWNGFSIYSYGDALKARLIFAVAGEIIMACYAIFCLVLFLNKRDILPKYMIGYFSYCLIFNIADFIFIALVTHYKVPSSYPNATLRSIVVAAIWIPYFLKSTRVKETFIVPHPSNNYSYEPPPGKTD